MILEFVTSLELVPPIYLPRASTVIRRMVELLQDAKFLKHVMATLHAWAVGLALATLISVPIGILIGTSELAYKMSSPLIEFMRPIPSVALIPLGILLWGQGFPMKVILVAYATTWPILFNTVYGVHDVDPIAVQTARCFGLKQAAILRHINLPSAAPFIFTGSSHLRVDRIDRRHRRRAACIRRQRHRVVHSVCVVQRRPDGLGPGWRGHRRNRRRDDQQRSRA